MKILIVDDERAIRNSLKEILGDEGYDVDVAEDGPSALAKVDKEKFDVIFCDIKMPGMDGTEVLEKIVADGVDSAVVMISGHGDIETAVECIKKGAFDFIQKPLDLNRILITIKNATDKVSIVKENRQQPPPHDRPRPALWHQMGMLQCGGQQARRLRRLLCLGRDAN